MCGLPPTFSLDCLPGIYTVHIDIVSQASPLPQIGAAEESGLARETNIDRRTTLVQVLMKMSGVLDDEQDCHTTVLAL